MSLIDDPFADMNESTYATSLLRIIFGFCRHQVEKASTPMLKLMHTIRGRHTVTRHELGTVGVTKTLHNVAIGQSL